MILNEYEKFGEGEFKEFWKHILINNPNGNKFSKNEYKGIYAFAEYSNGKTRVLYVGISQTMRRRFFKHTKEKGKEGATWAYAMLKWHHPQLSKEDRILMIPEIQNSLIKNCRFTFIPIESNMMIHLAEVYCANKLRAHWNSFETH